MKPKFIAANWKMHKTFVEGYELAKEIIEHVATHYMPDIEVALFPPFIHLQAISKLLSCSQQLYLGAQNCHYEMDGPFTGEVSASMLASIDVKYVLVGHSERRHYFSEGNELIAKKIDAILKCGLQPIFCCGEVLEVREKGQQYDFIKGQLAQSLFHLTPHHIQQLKIAYEPVWAIGTGMTPSLVEVKDMQNEIRDILSVQYNSQLAEKASVLYGGSCNSKNIAGFVSIPGIDGTLIGGASLDFREFVNILGSLNIN